MDKITAFADYKIPFILRRLWVLEYSQSLAYKIDNQIEIEKWSDEEIEIRSNTIWAIELMKQGFAVIIAGGTGNPFFTTDTASALRAVEIEADVLLKGTRVDGVYTADPEKDKTATRYDELTYEKAYKDDLHVMDLTAFTMCKENKLPIIVFDMNTPNNLKRLITGEKIGTLVKI